MATVDRDQVESYIARKGWQVLTVESGKEIVLDKCPLCGSESTKAKRRFYINRESGLWNTYCCNKSGNLFTLKRELGDLDKFAPIMRDASVEAAFKLAERLKSQKAAKAGKGKEEKDEVVVGASQLAVAHKALLADQEAMAYLRGRGFTDATITRFKLGLSKRRLWWCPSCGDHKEKGKISVRAVDPKPLKTCPDCGADLSKVGKPSWECKMVGIPVFEDGVCKNVKFRRVGEKGFERVTGAESTPFNIDSVKGKWKSLFVAEAELDAIALAQYGFEPVIGLTTGAAAGAKMLEKYRAKLADFDDIYLCLDMDKAGEDGARAIAETLGQYRCRRVDLPFKDAAECLENGVGIAEIQAAIDRSQSYAISAVKHISAYEGLLDRMFSLAQMNGVSTGIDKLDELVVGLQPGDVSVVTGDTGSGKSTFTRFICHNVASQNKPVLLCSFENTVQQTVRALLTLQGGKHASLMDPIERDDAFMELSRKPLYVLDRYGAMPWAEMEDAIEYGVRHHGLYLVVLDHLHFFLDDGSGGFADDRVMIDRTLRSVLNTAQRFGIHIMLVVHPAKLRYSRKGEELPPDLNDLKGSSEIKKIAAFAVRPWRQRTIDRRKENLGIPKAVITALKVRDERGREGSFEMRFSPEGQRYDEWVDVEPAKASGGRKYTPGMDNNDKDELEDLV